MARAAKEAKEARAARAAKQAKEARAETVAKVATMMTMMTMLLATMMTMLLATMMMTTTEVEGQVTGTAFERAIAVPKKCANGAATVEATTLTLLQPQRRPQ